VRLPLCFIQPDGYRTRGSGSDRLFFSQLRLGYKRGSTSGAPQRTGISLLSVRSPPGFPFPPKNIDTFEKYMFPASCGKMQRLAWEQVPPVPICPETEQGRKNKERPILCIKIAFPSSASSATTYN
jgi:hypothetical protein